MHLLRQLSLRLFVKTVDPAAVAADIAAACRRACAGADGRARI